MFDTFSHIKKIFPFLVLFTSIGFSQMRVQDLSECLISCNLKTIKKGHKLSKTTFEIKIESLGTLKENEILKLKLISQLSIVNDPLLTEKFIISSYYSKIKLLASLSSVTTKTANLHFYVFSYKVNKKTIIDYHSIIRICNKYYLLTLSSELEIERENPKISTFQCINEALKKISCQESS